MTSAEDYRNVVVAYRNGAPVKLEQIARVIDSVENDKIASWFNDTALIVLAIQRQPDANTVAVVDRGEGPAADVPRAGSARDRHGPAERSLDLDPRLGVSTCRRRWLIAIALVVLVIFLFLRSASATLIPALAVPVSLIGTCAAMYAFGFSINNMTLLALTLSVGFVVDDAIVMLENIVRHIEGGMRPFEAALKGAREIGFTIISITFSLIAVFIPVLLMGGMVGRVFREFAVIDRGRHHRLGLRVADADADAVRARAQGAPRGRGRSRTSCCACSRRCSRGWLRALRLDARQGPAFKSSCCWSRSPRSPRTVCALHLSFRRASSRPRIPASSPPRPKAPPTSRSRPWWTRQRKVAEIVGKDPAVDYVNSTVGVGGPNPTTNYGRLFIALKPQEERDNASAVIQRLRRTANTVTGMAVYFQAGAEHQHHAAAFPRATISTRCSRATPRRSTGRARDARQDRRRSTVCAMSPATSTSGIRR